MSRSAASCASEVLRLERDAPLSAILVGLVVFFVLAQFIDGRVGMFTGLGTALALGEWKAGRRAFADYIGVPVAVVLGIGAFFLLVQVNGWLGLLAGVAAAVAFQSWYASRRSFSHVVAEAGLTPDQAAAFKSAKGREGRIAQMAAIQDQQRAQLFASGVDVTAMTPEVGKDIAWGQIVRHVFRVREFDRTDTVIEDDTVQTTSDQKLYGYLLVESPVLNQPIRLPIVHRDDFWLTASVYDDPGSANFVNGPEGELLVTYAPKVKLPGDAVGITHGLHYLMAPRGTLERFYPDSPVGDRRMAKPEPETLFGRLVYKGHPAVQLNRNPAL